MKAITSTTTDWEAVEKLYRAGVLSVRAIGELYGVTEGAIRKRAKKEAWERDLTAKVQQKARDELVRSEVRTAHANADGVRTEQDIITQAALTVAEVVRSHRRDIAAGRNVVALLAAQLFQAAEHRPELEAIIIEETKADLTSDRRRTLMRAISLPTHAGTAKDLAAAMKYLIGLERQAFNVPDVPEQEPPEEAGGAAKAVTDGIEALRAAFAKRLGHAETA